MKLSSHQLLHTIDTERAGLAFVDGTGKVEHYST